MLGVRESYSEQKRPVSGQCGVLHHHHRVCFLLYLCLSFLRNRRASAEFEAPGMWIYSPPHSYPHPSPHLSPLSSFPWAQTVTGLDADACYHWVSPWMPTWSLHPWFRSGTVFKPWCVHLSGEAGYDTILHKPHPRLGRSETCPFSVSTWIASAMALAVVILF